MKNLELRKSLIKQIIEETKNFGVTDYEVVVNNLFSLIQAITDPENQPNQYGVKLETQILD